MGYKKDDSEEFTVGKMPEAKAALYSKTSVITSPDAADGALMPNFKAIVTAISNGETAL